MFQEAKPKSHFMSKVNPTASVFHPQICFVNSHPVLDIQGTS